MFPVAIPANALWESGRMPCDVSTAKSKIHIAMDMHSGSQECTMDRMLENFKAGNERVYLVLEGISRTVQTGTEYLVGAENEALINIASSVLVRMLLQEAIEVGKNASSEALDMVKRTARRNLASLAFSGQIREMFPEGERPGLLEALAKDSKIRGLSLSVELGALDETTWEDFGDRFSSLERDYFKEEKTIDERFQLYREIFISILNRYAQKLSDRKTAERWQAPLTPEDIEKLKALRSKDESFSEMQEKWASPLGKRLSLLRNAFIERAIADKYCATLSSPLPVISRLGINHVEDIFYSLQKRLKKSGAKWSSHLDLDSRALGYDSVVARFAEEEGGIKRYEHYREFARLIRDSSSQN
jgi:hypothetical protein